MIGSDSNFRDGFLLGAAKAFFVTAYADYVESDENKDDSLPQPGPGGDWMDCAPEPPPNAYALAGELWAGLERVNEGNVYMLANQAELADGEPPDPEDFGHCLAMSAMGHGVSWFDDHASFPLDTPDMEVTYFSFDPETYQPKEEQ